MPLNIPSITPKTTVMNLDILTKNPNQIKAMFEDLERQSKIERFEIFYEGEE